MGFEPARPPFSAPTLLLPTLLLVPPRDVSPHSPACSDPHPALLPFLDPLSALPGGTHTHPSCTFQGPGATRGLQCLFSTRWTAARPASLSFQIFPPRVPLGWVGVGRWVSGHAGGSGTRALSPVHQPLLTHVSAHIFFTHSRCLQMRRLVGRDASSSLLSCDNGWRCETQAWGDGEGI